VSAEAQTAMMQCIVEDDAISLPGGDRLDRRVYLEIKDILESLGGKWARGRQSFVFDRTEGDDLSEAFYEIAQEGKWVSPRDLGYFPTPAPLVVRMIAEAEVAPFHLILEPSAGRGAILDQLQQEGVPIDKLVTCEILPEHRAELERKGYNVDGEDFLWREFPAQFDRVLMNPPFGKGQAVTHVRKAISLLKPGGRLVAIMPSGIVQRQDRAHRELRAEIMKHGKILPVEDGTFKESGTDVRTVLVVYDRPQEAPKTEAKAFRRLERRGVGKVMT
jgi:hypothetical protein